MQIVIEIPDEIYRAYKMDSSLTFLNVERRVIAENYLVNGLINGTPLPKEHGRLIDADALPLNDIDDANYGSNYIRIAPTIIEADKGGD